LRGIRLPQTAPALRNPVHSGEHPRQPDPSRHHGASKDGIGLWWKVIGRNKRLATLDLSTPDGQELFRRIAKGADVVIENFRPGTLERWGLGWDELSADQRAQLKRRQGVSYPLQEGVTVLDPETMREVPRDGETIGEVMFRGNIVMKGYLKNEKATREAFAGGWFHTGDLGVLDEHGYVIIKDRSKDIIISGGENISSVEVEDILYKHPAVLFAAVVAKPDPKWGEVPCAFIELKDGATATEAEIIAYCRGHMSGFKTPKVVVFGPIPKTSTGKIQKFLLRNEVQSAKAISA